MIPLRSGSGYFPMAPDWPAVDGLVCGFGDRFVPAPPATILLRRQVHGAAVVDLPTGEAGLGLDPDDGLRRVEADADALVVHTPGRIVGVRTADCVPLLLVAPRIRWAAAVHAGWRGTIAGIATEAVKAATRAGARSGELLAALGPSIGPCCYEVSEELGLQFEDAGFAVQSRSGGAWRGRSTAAGKPYLDLRAANRRLLEVCGVPTAGIRNVGPCTRCSRDRFHSFRAEPGSPGRQVSWIGWADPAARTPSPDPAPTR